jgi:hypothetical protein
VKKFYIVVNFFIWIIIKNYWCDIKSGNVLILISSEKYKKIEKKKGTLTVIVLYCCLTNKSTKTEFQNYWQNRWWSSMSTND